MERDSKLIAELKQMLDFNSHAHVERDLDHRLQQAHEIHFNSHAHVERDHAPAASAAETLYFNSHAHVERDGRFSVTEMKTGISTHTLTWSVTLDVVYIWCLLNVMRTYCFI